MERLQKVSALITVLFAFSANPSFANLMSPSEHGAAGTTDFYSPLAEVPLPEGELDPDEFDPYDPQAEEILKEYDRVYEEETGQSPNIKTVQDFIDELINFASCRRIDCPVWVQIDRSKQLMYLYVNGRLNGSWAVSTGVRGHGTPRMDTHPNGRIYDKYSSRRYPGGDYKGLGNMPYAVFIRGPFAMHGTPKGNWSKLGRPASKGCIRMHPDNAYKVNRLIRSHGIRKVWVTVQ